MAITSSCLSVYTWKQTNKGIKNKAAAADGVFARSGPEPLSAQFRGPVRRWGRRSVSAAMTQCYPPASWLQVGCCGAVVRAVCCKLHVRRPCLLDRLAHRRDLRVGPFRHLSVPPHPAHRCSTTPYPCPLCPRPLPRHSLPHLRQGTPMNKWARPASSLLHQGCPGPYPLPIALAAPMPRHRGAVRPPRAVGFSVGAGFQWV